MAAVSLQQLRVNLGGRQVIPGLSLDIAEGEFLVLLGPSGCGKSTLLHAVAGLTDIAAGRILIGGDDVTAAEPAKRNIGMVFQSYALYPSMSVEKNLSFGLRVRRLPRAEIARRVHDAAALLQLTELLQRRPAALSGGQRQRVAIGRALVRDARVYLFDEPLSNLDASLRATLRRELKLLHRRLGATMIYVTHDQIEAMTLATRIAVMKEGVLQQVGTPDEVYSRPANLFVAGFLGAPPMNFLAGMLAMGDNGPRFVAAGLDLALDGTAVDHNALVAGRAVLLGVRPEHVRLDDHGALLARISLAEPTGAHQVISLEWRGGVLQALDTTQPPLSEGSEVRCTLDIARASLFDAASGTRL